MVVRAPCTGDLILFQCNLDTAFLSFHNLYHEVQALKLDCQLRPCCLFFFEIACSLSCQNRYKVKKLDLVAAKQLAIYVMLLFVSHTTKSFSHTRTLSGSFIPISNEKNANRKPLLILILFQSIIVLYNVITRRSYGLLSNPMKIARMLLYAAHKEHYKMKIY